MKQLSREEKLRLQVGLALMTGMFIAVPVTYGAPVHDANSGYNTLDPSKIVQSAEGSGVKTAVTGNSGDNVIAWKDFSVGANDKVVFDGGAKTNNYLNVVTGVATSQIDGAISGGQNVYLVNPNGVIFGKDAQVNVGALYVSTEDVASAVNAKANMGTNPSAVLQAGTPNADVVNLGSIQASKVQVEGTNIRFLDSAKVTTDGTTANTNVVLNAKLIQKDANNNDVNVGYAHVGNANGNSAGYTGTNLTQDFKLIYDKDGLVAAATAVNAQNSTATNKNYMLADNINMSSVQNFTPIGSSNTYGGTFDGMFYEVQNLTVNQNGNVGLFGDLSGAHIYNIGVQNPSIETTGTNSYAGGIAGTAVNSDFTNVYVENGSVKANIYAGGLAGSFYGGTISSAYNTSTVSDKQSSKNSSGLVAMLGKASTTTTLENAYNTGSADYGIYRTGAGTLTLKYIYTTGDPAGTNLNSANLNNSYYLNNGQVSLLKGSTTGDATAAASYSGWDIGNDGTGKHVWRIYEGVSTPILTAFLKGTATADYNYNYFTNSTDTTATNNGLTLAGGLSGQNSGTDITAIYNAQYLKVANSTKTGAGTAADVTLTSNADSSDITVNTAGIRNVNGNNLPQALISSGQHGYNIVGGNAIINKRTVAAQSGTFTITKEYDGNADGTEAFGQALSGSSGNVSFGGLLSGDDVQLSGVTATYKDANNQDDGNVGYGKTVAVTVGNSPGLSGSSAGNYTLDVSSLTNLSVTGDITPRTLYVKLKQTSGFGKTYDGTTAVTDSNAAAGTNVDIDLTKGDNHKFVGQETGTLDTSATLIAYNDKHAGINKTIDYTKIALTGTKAQNYMLVVENSSSATGYDVLYDGYANRNNTAANRVYGTGSLQATGTISQRAIDPASFQVKDAQGNIANGSKTYDGTSGFNSTGYTLVANATSTGNTGVVNGDNIIFSIVNGQANFQDASGQNTSSATASGLSDAATQIGYSITAAAGNNTTLLSDYTLKGSTLSNTGSYTVSGKGEIKKRAINVAVTQPNTVSLDKTYDSTQAVNDAKASVFGTGGYVDYASGSDSLTGNDGVTMQVSAAYDSKNAGNRTIDYTATLNGTNAANYDLNNTGTITVKMLGTNTGATGKISQLNLGSTFAAQTKTYDGTTNVPGLTGNADLTSALTGVLGTDTVKLQGNAAYHSKNVKGDANGQNWIDYTNLILSGSDAGNYTISSSAKGTGTISALTLSAGDFNYTFAPISKEYDGTQALSNAGSYITGVTVKGTGDVFKGTVGGQQVDYTRNVSGTFASKDSQNQANQNVTYSVTIIDDGSGNYTLPTTGIVDTTTATGKITPKTVIADIANTALSNTTKTYDATTDLIDGQGNVLTGDKVITFKDVNGNAGLVSGDSNASTAAYKDQNGVAAKDSYAGTKDIYYTAAITTTDQSNYNIVDSNQQAITAPMTGTGIINKRVLTVNFGKTEKTYDGTADVAKDAQHIIPTLGNDAGDGVALDVTKITGQYTGRTNNADVGDNLDVSYSNLQQSLAGNYSSTNPTLGTFADNYTIANTATGKGKISTLSLTNQNFKFDFKTITKEYDGSQNVAYTDRSGNAVTAESFINNHYVDMDGDNQYTAGKDVLLQGITATSAIYAGSDSNNSTPQNVTYSLTLGNNLSNFNTSGLTNMTMGWGSLSYNNGVLTANTTGTITPRAVYASLGNYVPTKTYDGNTNIPQSIQQNVENNVSLNGLLGTDGVTLNTAAIQAHYDGSDAGTQNVIYNVQLTDGNTGKLSNYVLTGAAGANYTSTSVSQGALTGTGTINKAPLTISFGDVTKDYDGSANVLPGAITATLSGFVNSESDAPAEAAIRQQITGTYGTWDAINGVQGDANVNRQTPYVPNEAYGYKGVVYQNINGALNNYVQGNGTAAARNYYIDLTGTANADASGNTVAGTVADTLYFKEAAQKGYIKPLALTAGAIHEKWVGPITKVYDGDAYVKNANGSLNDYLKLEATVSPNGNTQTINVPYTVLATNATYNGGKDVSTSNQGVTYKLSGLTAQAMGNFVITQADADLFDIAKGGNRATINSANATTPPVTSITPKVIGTGLTKNTDIDKVYNANDTADKSNASFNVNDILTADQGTVSVVVTDAYYADMTTGSRKQDASAMPGQGTDAYDVKYTYTLSGIGSGNYTLATATNGGTQYGLTLTGTGDILKRAVYVDFGQGNGTGLDKAYDGKQDVAAAYKDPTRFTLSQESGDTGVLQAEQNIVQLANNISAAYQYKDVQRQGNGLAKTQDVIFSNFNLTGTTSGNYYLTTADGSGTLKGSGTISPLTLGVSIKNAPTKEYDGTTALSNDYNSKANINVNPANLVSGDTINVGVVSADYADKNAANGTKVYTYDLNWDNGNYDLAVQSTANGETMQVTGYANGKVTGSLSGTNGTITPRTLTVQSVKNADKEYDGTTAVVNAAYNVDLGNIVNGDNVGLVANGQYDDANASASDISAAPVVQNVNYTLNLTNGNYQLAQNTAQGKGTIRRKGLAIVADPVSINAGEAMPVFTGKVTGFVNGERDNYTAFINGLIYKTKDGVSNTTPGSYGVYGWYMGKKNGLVGRNYIFDQSAANDSALTINYVNTHMGNPDTKITPNNNVYNQISKDMNSGFGDNGVAAIEYQDKGGKVLARENIDSGEIHSSGLKMGTDAGDMSNRDKGTSNIGIVGGDIVNMEGVDAAGSANIEVSGSGTTVNLEVVDITNADNKQSSAGIEIMDEKKDILGEEAKDKKEKESEIAIKSSSGAHEDEIELKVESDGVNVA